MKNVYEGTSPFSRVSVGIVLISQTRHYPHPEQKDVSASRHILWSSLLHLAHQLLPSSFGFLNSFQSKKILAATTTPVIPEKITVLEAEPDNHFHKTAKRMTPMTGAAIYDKRCSLDLFIFRYSSRLIVRSMFRGAFPSDNKNRILRVLRV